MPLTPCPDCNREVSTSARQCVHCGRPWPASRCGAGALVIGLLVAFCVFGGIALARAKHGRAESRCRVERAIAPTVTTTPAPAETPVPAAAPVKEEE